MIYSMYFRPPGCKRLIVSILLLVYILSSGSLYAEQPSSLMEITENIENYRGRTVSMNLRLKQHDRVFNRIIFYDRDNINIEFHISSRRERKRLESYIVNLHNGVTYEVIFTVRDVGALGLLVADPVSFEPVVMEKLP